MVERRASGGRTFWQRALAGRTTPAKPDPATVTALLAGPGSALLRQARAEKRVPRAPTPQPRAAEPKPAAPARVPPARESPRRDPGRAPARPRASPKRSPKKKPEKP